MNVKLFSLLVLAAGGLLLVAACGGDGGAGAVSPLDGNGAAAPPLNASGGLQPISNGQPQGITVSGQGSASGEPDTALLSLGVSVLADTARGARDQAAEAMNDLLDSVKGNGIDPQKIKTTQFALNPEYDYSRAGLPRLIGYRVTNMVAVKVQELDRVPEVIDEAVDAVGDPIQISGISFSVDDPEALLAQARAEAMADAQAKAQQLADLAGVELDKPTFISESSLGGPPQFFPAPHLALEEASTPIEPGQLEIAVSVQVTYAIL